MTSKRVLATLCATLLSAVSAQSAEVNVYSGRGEALIKPLLDTFSKETGIKVNLVSGKDDALIERLKAEGAQSPADVLMTADAGRLHRAKAAGLLQAVDSPTLNAAIPAAYRDPGNQWFGLTLRARVIVYAPERVKREELSTYEGLADPSWKGRVCMRSSDSIYNQSLTAALIAHDGEAATLDWAKGVVANLARPPKGGDRDQIKAIAAGECDVSLVNTYYLAGMQNAEEPAEREAAAKVAVFWPNQKDRGAHVNVSGAGITAAAKNVAEARKLLEFLVSDEAQRWYAEVNQEYPVKAGIAISPTLRTMGAFKADALPLARLGELNAQAVRLLDRAGWR
ncbi:Fe(3+) ABC transporter substrate-binding protein [Thiofaba sp. EF100]|uniref:Fe(3+) ABC transporter substrate-binding protein n=1 Tax=Thiofaba sp. EF100 TaxID=3121274 RepID=UPI003221A843